MNAVRRFHVAGTSATYLASTLREVFHLCVKYNVRIQARWIAGFRNKMADALSRQKWRTVGCVLRNYVWTQHGYSSPYALGLPLTLPNLNYVRK